MQSYRLKSGVTFWRTTSGQLRIGTRFRNYQLPNLIAGQDLEPLLVELGFGIEPRIDFVKYGPALSMLANLSLIDSKNTLNPLLQKTQLSKSKTLNPLVDTARENLQARFEIEMAGISKRSQVQDGGTETLLRRQEIKISIMGEGNFGFSRVAVAIYSNLLASGFSQCEFRNSSTNLKSEVRVGIEDLIGGYFRLGDVGLPKLEVLRRASAEISLFPQKSGGTKQNDRELIISIGPPHPHIQLESSTRMIPILVIDFVSGDELRIGPMIFPGKNLCYSCILLGEKESGSLTKIENAYFRSDFSELSAALAITGAGYISLAVAEFADTGGSPLAGKTINISTENYLAPEIKSWQRHPNCTCNWALT